MLFSFRKLPVVKFMTTAVCTAQLGVRSRGLSLPVAGSISMFPRELGEEVFSLRPDREGNALSICMVLDDEGAILERSATCSTIRPTRITYDDLDRRLPAANEQSDADLLALLKVKPPQPVRPRATVDNAISVRHHHTLHVARSGHRVLPRAVER